MNLVPFAALLAAFPAIIIGAVTMYSNGIPVAVFGQNMVCSLVAVLTSYLIVLRKIKLTFKNNSILAIAVSVILLLLTFFDSGLEDVHRWISIGPFRLYVASIVLPVLIIEIWNLLQTENWLLSGIISIAIAFMLFLQPDASQLTAFVVPILILLLIQTGNNLYRFSMAGLLITLVVASWIFLDGLPPVSYVEKIVVLAAAMGPVWLALAFLSLVLLPLPFIFLAPRNTRLLSLCIGVYYAIVLISTVFGNFPVPLMGYGISPIIGYFISATWLINCRFSSSRI